MNTGFTSQTSSPIPEKGVAALENTLCAYDAQMLSLAKKHAFWARLSAIACIVMLGILAYCAIVLLPQVSQTLQDVQRVIGHVDSIDWDALKSGVEGFSKAGTEMNKIDFTAISDAIAKIEETLSSLFGWIR